MPVSIKEVLDADRAIKPDTFVEDSEKLRNLYEGRGRQMIRQYLKDLGMGEWRADPIQSGVVRRLVSAKSVLYTSPPIRLLRRKRELLAPGAKESQDLEELEERCGWNETFAAIDKQRHLYRSVAVEWAESFEERAIVARVYPPDKVHRMVDPGAKDKIGRDRAIAICLLGVGGPRAQRYRLYERYDEGWAITVVDGEDNVLDRPYGDDLLPFDRLPIQLFTDEPLLGCAWLQPPQPTVAVSLGADVILSELMILVKHQGHSKEYATAGAQEFMDSVRGAIEETGPDVVPVLPPDSKIDILTQSPEIEGSIGVVKRYMSSLAIANGLPADNFSEDQPAQSSEALRIKERDLDRARRELSGLAGRQEAEAFEIHKSILAVYGGELELPQFPEDVRMITLFSPAWQPSSVRDAQDISVKEIAAGSKSLVEHTAERYGCSMSHAKALLRQIAIWRKEFPLAQNPGALQEGPRAALGEGSATPRVVDQTGGELLSGSVEGASMIAAARRTNGA